MSMSCITQNGWTPLMTASFEGHADIVQTLIEAKAQVNTQQEVAILFLPPKMNRTKVCAILIYMQALHHTLYSRPYSVVYTTCLEHVVALALLILLVLCWLHQ